MKMKSLIAIPALALALSLGAATGFAAPLGSMDVAAPEGMVHKTAGCHRSCEWGPVLGWHRHVGASCRPIACAPRAAEPDRCWIDRWGVRRCRW